MNTEPEPLAAILAEMRKAVVPMICGRPKIEAIALAVFEMTPKKREGGAK